MLNLKEIVNSKINSVELTENKDTVNSIVRVFFENNDINSNLTELYDILRFRIIQIEDNESNKILFKSLNTDKVKKYVKNDLNINKIMSYSDDEVNFKYYDISFLDILSSKNSIKVVGNKKIKTHLFDFKFQLKSNFKNLTYYTIIYVDTNIISKKLKMKDDIINDNIYISFETFIKNNKSLNAKLKDYRQLKKIDIHLFFDDYQDKFVIDSFKEKILRKNIKKNIDNENIIYFFDKSRNNDGFNISFLIDLFQVYLNYSKYNHLLRNEKFNDIIFEHIRNTQNIKIKIIKKYKNEEVKLIENKDIKIENNFYQNNKVLNHFSFYDTNLDNSSEFIYEICVYIQDVLVDFLKNLLDQLKDSIETVQYLLCTATKTTYYNHDLEIFNDIYFQEIYQKNSHVLFDLVDLLVYVSDYLINVSIDKLALISLINEDTLSLKTLNMFLNIFENLYMDINTEYSLNKTYNQLEFYCEKSIHPCKTDVYYNVLRQNESIDLKNVTFSELSELTQNGILKYYQGGSVNNINTYAFHSPNSINFNGREQKLDSPISKTNVTELNYYILYFLYYINNKTFDSSFYNQIFDLLFDEYLIFQKYDNFKEIGQSVISLSGEKKTTEKQQVEIENKINLLLNVFIDDLFIKHKDLFDIWLINKKRITNEIPYQISALFNSYVGSELVYDTFQSVTFLEKFIFIYLYKMIFQIEYFDLQDLKWKLLTNSLTEQTKNKSLICRFTKYISSEFNVPYLKELDFDLNNKYFIFKNKGEDLEQEVRETYLDLVLMNRNIVEVKKDINLPSKLLDNKQEIQNSLQLSTKAVSLELKNQLANTNKAIQQTVLSAEGKINTQIQGLEDKIKNVNTDSKSKTYIDPKSQDVENTKTIESFKNTLKTNTRVQKTLSSIISDKLDLKR